MRTFFTAKADSLKSEEMSMTERIKERQNHKSKSIMDDPKYKDIISNNSFKINSPSESSTAKKINGRSTSSFNGPNVNTSYNNFSINLNNNFGPGKKKIDDDFNFLIDLFFS